MTVDRLLIDAGGEAVASGAADSLSGWVNLALVERAAKERRLRALGEAVASYEARFGAISDAEIAAQERADRRVAVVVRERRRALSARRRRGAK